MVDALANRSWTFLVRGIAAILLGIVAFVWPGITVVALTLAFGAYAFIDGVLAVAAALGGFGASRWWALLLEGIAGLVVAFFVYTQPAMSIVSLVYLVGAWAVLTGVVEIIAGLQLREVVTNEWLYILAGIVSIAFGILIIRNPQAGALAVVWMVGFYAVIFGILELSLSYRLNRIRSAISHGVHAA